MQNRKMLTAFHDALSASVDGLLQSGAEQNDDLPKMTNDQPLRHQGIIATE
jgi:hypothetical protein